MSDAARAGDVKTDPLEIRHARESDLAAIDRLYNHYVQTSHITFDIDPLTAEERREWFRVFSDQGRHQLFVAYRGSQFLGYAHSKPLRPKGAYGTSVETTIYLDPAQTRGGVGRKLYGVLLDALRREDVHRAYGGIALPNDGSVAFHEKMGFRQMARYDEVGRKFGEYWSVVWYEMGLP